MPKYQPDLGTKLVIPEEEINLPDLDEDVPDTWDLDDPDHVKVKVMLLPMTAHCPHAPITSMRLYLDHT